MNPTTYTVEVSHWDDGELSVAVKDAGSSESDRASIAWALRQAADMVEHGLPVHRESYS